MGDSASASGFNVLVVDDSPIYRKLVEQALAKEQFSIQYAKNGREAIDLFREHQPALVITDWMMPDISGPELCRRIRHDFQRNHAHLILVTSNTDKEQVIEGLAAGADDYITKPFHPGELLARVRVGRRIIELHRQVEAKSRELEALALTDPLTGLPNRRAIDLWASQQLSAAARHGFSIWAVLADLDHFKSINDTHGHEAGDAVLQQFSRVLKTNTRRSDLSGRLGGEEFLMLFTHLDRGQVAIAIDKFREAFLSEDICFGTKKLRVTASFGAAMFSGKRSPELSALLARADTALYAAKNKGRNRVEFDSD